MWKNEFSSNPESEIIYEFVVNSCGNPNDIDTNQLGIFYMKIIFWWEFLFFEDIGLPLGVLCVQNLFENIKKVILENGESNSVKLTLQSSRIKEADSTFQGHTYLHCDVQLCDSDQSFQNLFLSFYENNICYAYLNKMFF